MIDRRHKIGGIQLDGQLKGSSVMVFNHRERAGRTTSGMSLVTTLPAPMTAFDPIFTPGQMIAPPPTHTSEPISIGLGELLLAAQFGVHRVRGGVNLDCWS